jgi:chromosome segregation ATPase
MNRKMLFLLVAAMLVVGMVGCEKQGAKTSKKTGTKSETGTTAREGTATAPGETTGAAAGQAVAQQKQEFIANADKMLTNLEQQEKTWEAQLPASEQNSPKVQQLKQQFQQQIASTRQSLDKLRSASPESWGDLRSSVDSSLASLQGTYRDMQSVSSQAQRPAAQGQTAAG